MNAGPAGFRGAPLSKVLVVASLASSIIVQTASRASRRRVPIFLTAFSQAFVFRQPGELLLGTMLAYYFRLLERQMGTGKYAAYVLAASGISFTLQAVVSSLWHRPSASGLYPILFSNLVAFFLEVPPLQKFSFLGINMSDKAFIYLVALQLLFAGSQRSVVAALSGLLAGLVYHTNCFGMRRLRLPRAIEEAIGQTFGRAIDAPGARQQIFVTPVAMAQPGVPATRPLPSGVDPGQQRRQDQRVEVSPEVVQQLVDMGFDAARARQALQQAGNDVELAIQSLL